MLFLFRSGIEETKREDCGLVNGSSSSILDQWAMKNRAEEEGMLFLFRSGIEETKREDCGLVNGSSSSILDQWAMKNRAEEEGMWGKYWRKKIEQTLEGK